MIYLLSFLASGLCAWFISKYAVLIGLVDQPCERSSHVVPTPKGGGIGLALIFASTSIWFGLPPYFWIPGTLIAMVSFYNDRDEVHPKVRLLLQFVSAAVFLTFHSFLNQSFLSEMSPYLVLFIFFFLLFFIVATTNFFNFMDGINGIAAITGMVAFVLLGCYGLVMGKSEGLTFFCFSMAFACLGFLPFNLFKAKVFLGDVGSILLGFCFAATSILVADSIVEFVIFCGFLVPFYIDELISMVERKVKGVSLLQPHRTHLYQLLANEYGIPHWRVSIGYGFVQSVTGMFIWWSMSCSSIKGLLFTSLFMVLLLLITYTWKMYLYKQMK